MTAKEIRGEGEKFKRAFNSDTSIPADAMRAIQISALWEIAAQLAELNANTKQPMTVVNLPPDMPDGY